MNIGATARKHGTTALLGLAIASFGTATALAGSPSGMTPPLPTTLPASPQLSASPVVAKAARPAQARSGRTLRNRRQAQAVPFFAFPPRI
ncbi:hypothetical protein [Solilutibacter silvestris]|uniref:hypothetical protein n=1 Tax=Solilutibacter silvestris TaxID=1645665 RepID=UPI003D327A18